jgi:hypothetical protein
MLRRASALGLAVVSGCLLTGCGSAYISTSSARAALESAGFHRLVVARGLGVEEPTFDEIGLQPNPPFFSSLRLVRFHSVKEAKRAFGVDGDYSRAGIRAFRTYVRRYPTPIAGETRLAFPPGFELRKVFSFRICNVILFSYNARLDSRLTAKVSHAATKLREKCH